MDNRPAFLITVDTEGDDLWSRPRTITTRNAAYLPRFQVLCEAYGLEPTYLVNWEMANCSIFQEFARDVLRRKAGEVGMHLHAWNSPPLEQLTNDDFECQPYLIEYPEELMREKVKVMTEILENVFQVKPISHRAGRWGLDEAYARILVDHGYRVDCSVTPHYSWQHCLGAPAGLGGTDFTRFPDFAYFVDLNDISRAGESTLLEVPLTIIKRRWPPVIDGMRRLVRHVQLGERVMRKVFPILRWLYPDGRNGVALRSIMKTAREEGRDYVELAIHSSELMPGGRAKFSTAENVERLYGGLETLFSEARVGFEGITLSDYYNRFRTGARHQNV